MGPMSNSQFSTDQDGREMLIKWPGKAYKDYLALINRFDLPDGFAYLDGLRGYIFVTRPDLNLFDDKLMLNEQAASKLSFNEFAGTSRGADDLNIYIAQMLTRNTNYPSPFIIPLTNRAKGYSPEDQSLDSLEIGETFYGARIKYGKHSGQSRAAGSITLSFEDDKYLTLYKLISLWTDYIEMVYLGDMKPSIWYIRQNQLDYAVSLFFLVARVTSEPIPVSDGSKMMKNGYEIVFCEKLTGLFPKVRPDSGFAHSKGQFIQPEFSVQFDYSLKSKSGILDPVILSEFNMMTRWQHNANKTPFSTYEPVYNQISGDYDMEVGTKLVNVPSVFRTNGKFYLEWL